MRGTVKAFSFRRRNISGSGSASVRLSHRWSGSWSPGASVAALRSISRGFRLSRSNHAGNTKAPQIALYSVLEGSDCKPPRIWSSCAPSPAVKSRHIGAARIPPSLRKSKVFAANRGCARSIPTGKKSKRGVFLKIRAFRARCAASARCFV